MYAQLFHCSRLGLLAIGAILGLVFIGWAQILPLSQRFVNLQGSLYSLGQLTALLGLSLIAINLILSGRFKRLEGFFGGMDKMYILHHILGGIGFILVLLHPLFIAGSYYIDSPRAASAILLLGPSIYKNLGNISLLMFMGLMTLTLFVKLPYELWHKTHKLMGVAFLLGGVHGYFTGSNIRGSILLQGLIISLTVAAMLVYLYRTVFGRFLIFRYRYIIDSIKPLNNEVVRITLATKGERIRFTPGQFAFFTFSLKNGKKETHPFSISSDQGKKTIAITVKALGDFTSKTKELKTGSVVWIEGPYGRFLADHARDQVWIAGGIGVTPFASRVMSGLHEYKQVDFFYTASDVSEMVYVKELINQSEQFKQLKLHLHTTKEKGRLTAELLQEHIKHIKKRIYYLCGPIAMMNSLRQQLIQAGVPDKQIYIEQFSIDER